MPEMFADVVLVIRGGRRYPVVDCRLGEAHTLFPAKPSRHLLWQPPFLADELKGTAALVRRDRPVTRVPRLAPPKLERVKRSSYTQWLLKLQQISRETLLMLTQIAPAMKLNVSFFWSNTLFVYFCSEIDCLYISQ